MIKNPSKEEDLLDPFKQRDILTTEIQQLREMAENQDRELSFQEECHRKLRQENAELLKNRITNQISLKNLEETLKIKSKNPPKNSNPNDSSVYDLIVHIDSFQRILWYLENNMSESIKDEYLENPPPQIVIGIMGREKVGKSYLMSQLSGIDLPVGYNIQTQGLSLKYSDKDFIKTTCLDSAGVHAPVYYYDPTIHEKFINKATSNINAKSHIHDEKIEKTIYFNDKFKEFKDGGGQKIDKFENLSYMMKESLKMQMINDRKLTETFIEDFILSVSKVILIVVGQLTQDDQAIIERIRREYKEKKFIIIIHNFMYLSSESSIKAQIEKDIFKSCEIEERGIPGSKIQYYCEKLDPNSKTKYQIAHFIYCQENTEMGELYNTACLKHIWDKIKTIDERERFSVFDALKRFFALNYKNYLKLNFGGELKNETFLENQQDQQFPNNNLISFNEKESLIDLVYDKESQLITLKFKEEGWSVTPQNPTFTALGSLIVNNLSEFEPKFELIEYSDNEFVCSFEICSLEIESLKPDICREINNENLLIIRGSKTPITSSILKKWKYAGALGLQQLGGIKYGNFEKMISITGLKDEYYIKKVDGKPKISYRDGVLLVFFTKKDKTKKMVKF